MKWTFLILAFTFITVAQSQPAIEKSEAASLLSSANDAFLNKKYEEAVVSYEKLVSAGYETADLHHNLSLSYHYTGALAESILNMERAKRSAPLNRNVKRNLKLLYENVDTEVQNVPPFFLKAWANAAAILLPSLGWFVLHLLFLISAILVLYLYLIKDFNVGGLHFYYTRGLIIGLAILSLLFAALAYGSDQHKYDSQAAIIMQSDTALRAGADLSSIVNTELPEGLKVFIKDEIGSFYKIRLGDFTDGWVEKGSLSRIRE